MVSLLDLALLPIRIARHIADAVVRPEAPAPAPPAGLVVVDGMPEGVPPAARRPEPRLPTPAGWPFGEEFPRTCGTARLAGGALFWTDRGAVAEVDARSYARPGTSTRPPGCTANWTGGWGLPSGRCASITVDVERAGLAALPSSTLSVATDTATQITLGGLGAGVVVQVDGQPAGPSVALLPGRHRIDLIRKAFDALGVSHRSLGRGVARIHIDELVGGQVRLAADRGERLPVGLEGFHVLSVCRADRVVKLLGRGELTEHPRHQWAARKAVGPFLGVPTRAVRLVGPRVQQSSVDKHRDDANNGAVSGQFTPRVIRVAIGR